jgi:anti-sigma B factor antagonist
VAPASNDRMSAQLSLHRTIDRGQVVRFSVAGEIDISVAGMFRDALMAALHRRRVTTLIIDLGPLRFMDSSGARVLTDVRREADRRDVAVVVVNAHGPARTILTVLDLYDELTCMPDDADQRCRSSPDAQEVPSRSQAPRYPGPLVHATVDCLISTLRHHRDRRVRPRGPA